MMKLSIITLYELNKTYIAENICVNKNKPQLHCNGKCYLKKQLERTDNNLTQENKSTSIKADVTDIVLCKKNFFLLLVTSMSQNINKTSYRNIFHTTSYVVKIFQPPEQIFIS